MPGIGRRPVRRDQSQLCLKGYVPEPESQAHRPGLCLRAAGFQGGVFSDGRRMTRQEGCFLEPSGRALTWHLQFLFLGLTLAKSIPLPVPQFLLWSHGSRRQMPPNTLTHKHTCTHACTRTLPKLGSTLSVSTLAGLLSKRR